MRPAMLRFAGAIFITALPMLAQWPNFPGTNVPRDAKGQPDLNGPTPKAADGHPDLSGVWELARGAGRASASADWSAFCKRCGDCAAA